MTRIFPAAIPHNPMRSALGIKKISQAKVSQVLHATDADTAVLRSHMQRWGVPNFSSFPLLLRALTHTSVSNWAEHALDLPKRSLSPVTLELLGDRVVGVAVAHAILSWIRDAPTAPSIDWSGGARCVLPTLIGNRGMAHVARSMGLPSLLRWEKARPPASHRPRLDALGFDLATGIPSNVEVNALSAAFESVAAAVYLGCGYDAARQFVESTLLAGKPAELQDLNRDVRSFENVLVREVPAVLGRPVALDTPAADESVVLQIVNCQREFNEQDNPAHTLFYTAVVLRPASEVDRPFKENDILSLSSHFSIETARIAALEAAVATLRGTRPQFGGTSSRGARVTETLCTRPLSSSSTSGNETGKDTNASLSFTTAFDEHGRWLRDGDYAHVAQVLARVGLSSQCNTINETETREELQALYATRVAAEDALLGKEAFEREEKTIKSTGGFQRRGLLGDEIHDPCAKAVEQCMAVGAKKHRECELTSQYGAVLDGPVGTAEEVVNAVGDGMRAAGARPWRERRRELGGLNVLGHQTIRLWSTQRSLRRVGQDRAEVVPVLERRAGLTEVLTPLLLGRDGLAGVRDLRVKAGYVGVGLCVERLGTPTALAWLSGAEAILEGENDEVIRQQG